MSGSPAHKIPENLIIDSASQNEPAPDSTTNTPYCSGLGIAWQGNLYPFYVWSVGMC